VLDLLLFSDKFSIVTGLADNYLSMLHLTLQDFHCHHRQSFHRGSACATVVDCSTHPYRLALRGFYGLLPSHPILGSINPHQAPLPFCKTYSNLLIVGGYQRSITSTVIPYILPKIWFYPLVPFCQFVQRRCKTGNNSHRLDAQHALAYFCFKSKSKTIPVFW
jgi:hypothetical protein